MKVCPLQMSLRKNRSRCIMFHMKSLIRPRKLALYWRVFDLLMSPFMRLISGAIRERPQETHYWHVQTLPRDLLPLLNKSKLACSIGEELSRHKVVGGILFHIPILSGWKNYVVVEVQEQLEEWYVGWTIFTEKEENLFRFDIHKLPIKTRELRLLDGTNNTRFCFFAFTKDGIQLPLKIVGRGRIGDGKYPNIRLF